MSEMTDEQLAWIKARAEGGLLNELAPKDTGSDELRVRGSELAQLMQDRDDLLAEVQRLRTA
jgi:hypothetical protein